VEKVAKNLDYFENFQKTAQNKQSPSKRKFDQSGHPDQRAPTGKVAAAGLPDGIFSNQRSLFG
jgi:hypothetical protein